MTGTEERGGAEKGGDPPPRYGGSRGANSPAPRNEGSDLDTITRFNSSPFGSRASSHRMVPVSRCGCIRDPEHDVHRCSSEITDVMIDAYSAAAQHLLDHGVTPAPNVPAMRVMWRRGGADQRLARRISERWEMVA